MNSAFTSHRDSIWDTTGGMMHCKRMEVQLYDRVEGMPSNPSDPNSEPAPAIPFNQMACNRAIVTNGSGFDVDRLNKEKGLPTGAKGWRFYRGGCPVPTVDTKTGRVLSWSLPPCGKWGTIICDQDTAI